MLKELITKFFAELLSPKKRSVAVLHNSGFSRGGSSPESRHVRPAGRKAYVGRQEPSSAPRNNWRAIKPS